MLQARAKKVRCPCDKSMTSMQQNNDTRATKLRFCGSISPHGLIRANPNRGFICHRSNAISRKWTLTAFFSRRISLFCTVPLFLALESLLNALAHRQRTFQVLRQWRLSRALFVPCRIRRAPPFLPLPGPFILVFTGLSIPIFSCIRSYLLGRPIPAFTGAFHS